MGYIHGHLTDSTFLSALPVIKAKNPDIDENDEELMCSMISDVAHEVQNFINQSYNVMAKKMFNIYNSHRFEIKQENIARRGIWLAKKRYVQKIIWENGVTINEVNAKGLDVVRSDFPKAFKNFMNEILNDLLNGVEKDVVDRKIIEFKDGLGKREFIEVGKPTGVKGIKKYSIKGGLSDVKKGTPAHVKSAIYYNNFLKEKGLEDKIQPITDGSKIVWVYLKQNPFNLDIIALKGSDDPDEVIDFISKYVDYDKMFDRLLRNKILDFYEALNWETFENVNLKANQFFSF